MASDVAAISLGLSGTGGSDAADTALQSHKQTLVGLGVVFAAVYLQPFFDELRELDTAALYICLLALLALAAVQGLMSVFSPTETGLIESVKLLLCTGIFAICARHSGTSCSTFLKVLSVHILPTLAGRETSGGLPFRLYLAAHLLMTMYIFRNDMRGEGWQYLLTLLAHDAVLLDAASLRRLDKQSRDLIALIYKAVKSLMSVICDGIVIVDKDGYVIGVDRKAESLFGFKVDSKTGIVVGGQKIFSYMEGNTGTGIDAIMAQGLSTMTLKSRHGFLLESEVYTIPCSIPNEAIPMLIGRKGSGATSLQPRDKYLLGVRVLSERSEEEEKPRRPEPEPAKNIGGRKKEGPQPSTGFLGNFDRQAEAQSSADSPPLTPRTTLSKANAHKPSFAVSGAEGPWGKTQVAMGLGVGEYTRVRAVARGSQATVFEVRGADGERYACKEIPLKGKVWQRDFPKHLSEADREARILLSLSWASGVIVRMKECWLASDFSAACIVMEWLPMTLSAHLEGKRKCGARVNAEDSTRWICHMTAALAAIHGSGYIHRDVKPSNVLMTEDLSRCKLADLGVSRPMHRATPGGREPSEVGGPSASVVSLDEARSVLSGYTEKPGTRVYASPESVQAGGHYGLETDIFSMGCVVLEVLTLCRIPEMQLCTKIGDGDGADLMIQRLLKDAQVSAEASGVGDPDQYEKLSALCIRMLHKNPQRRPSAVQALAEPVLAAEVAALMEAEPRLRPAISGEMEMRSELSRLGIGLRGGSTGAANGFSALSSLGTGGGNPLELGGGGAKGAVSMSSLSAKLATMEHMQRDSPSRQNDEAPTMHRLQVPKHLPQHPSVPKLSLKGSIGSPRR